MMVWMYPQSSTVCKSMGGLHRSTKSSSTWTLRSGFRMITTVLMLLVLVFFDATAVANHLQQGITLKFAQGSRSWRRLIESSVAAYELINDGVSVDLLGYASSYDAPNSASTPSQLVRSQLFANTVDLGFVETYQQMSDTITSPDLVSVPLAAQAMVVAYNLPGISDGSLTLSMDIVARIFLGNITMWNDPAVANLNAGVTLPAVNITLVVRADIVVSTGVFDQGMRSTSSEWASRVPQPDYSQHVRWPYTEHILYRRNRFSQATAMATIPYTITYMWLDEANDLGVPYVAFKSSNGVTLTPTTDSILFAVMEKGGPGVITPAGFLDLTVASNPYAWPLCNYAWMSLRKIAFRQTCQINEETLRFMLWFYEASTAASIANTLGFVVPPTQTITQHGILDLINNQIFCAGTLVLPAENTLTSSGIGSELATEIMELFPSVYASVSGANGTIDWTETESDDSLERLMWGEVDFAITVASSMDEGELEAALESDEVMQLPLFIARFVQIHSLPTIGSDDEEGLILDAATLSDIWTGKVFQWNDPKIAALNPSLQASGRLPSMNITRIVVTQGSREADRRFFSILHDLTKGTSSEFPITLSENGASNAPLYASRWIQNQTNVVYVGSQEKLQAAVVNLPGAIGITSVTATLEPSTMRTRFQKANGEINTENIAGSYRCLVDTFNSTFNRYRNSHSQQAGCWPFSTYAYVMVRKENTGDECINAPRALAFLQYLFQQTSTEAIGASYLPAYTTDAADIEWSKGADDNFLSTSQANIARTSSVAQGLGALWSVPSIQSMVIASLQAVTCEGETILVTLPVDHRIGAAVQGATLGITILGAICIALILCFLYFFHLRSAIKASSPLFLVATIVGMLFLFVSGTLLAQNDPDDQSCASGWWLLNLGFYLAFGPLFAKCWRIYKIFMRKEMTVIRLTDANLFLRIFIILSMELLLLGIMQQVDPVRRRVVVQSALPRDQTIYFCAPEGVGFAAATTSWKGLMLLFGAMMSFSTRSVSENFNESKPIAFSIYNVLFTCCIVVPIALLNQSDGRTLYLLVIFGIYWITFTTFLIVFAPKVIAIYKDASGLFAQRISDSKASASEIARSSAQLGRTIKELSQIPIRLMDRQTLRSYVVLLEKELTQSRAALATLDANEGVLAAAGHLMGVKEGARPLSQTGGFGPNLSKLDTNQVQGIGSLATPTNRAITPIGSLGTAAARYQAGGGGSSPKAADRTLGLQRTSSTAFANKYGSGPTAPGGVATAAPSLVSSSATPTPGVVSPNIRSIASVAPVPTPPVASSSATTSMAPRPRASAAEIKISAPLPGSPSHSTIDSSLGDDGGGSHRTAETRFRMPGPSPAVITVPTPTVTTPAPVSAITGLSILSSSGVNLSPTTPSPTSTDPLLPAATSS